jgi:hypothetical protein
MQPLLTLAVLSCCDNQSDCPLQFDTVRAGASSPRRHLADALLAILSRAARRSFPAGACLCRGRGGEGEARATLEAAHILPVQ